ncbi:hypothetical protein D893_01175 [Thioalkalivibrio sp. ALE21]|uniref:hypothetical protein n=1 Tax=Thioalkalivibrio sp. ALE21 TaxID=1158175 RepID=UPI000D808B9F|nr:hypothetical protein [Thioalkalivibrio sp. ALE21]PYG03310.1 hypothetical protein D893_01175 [Thioalkalivibrio sp. ALE21]
MALLIPYVIVILMAVGILSDPRRASFRTRVIYAVLVLAAPPALTGVGIVTAGLGVINPPSPGLILLGYVIVPLLMAWHFVSRHPYTPDGKQEMKSFRLSKGSPPEGSPPDIARDEQAGSKDFEATVVLGGYFALVLSASYLLPRNVLSSMPSVREFVGFMEVHFSGVERFGLWSKFPEVAQLVYSVQLLLVPAFVVWTVVSLRVHLRKVPGLVWKGVLMIPAFGAAAFLLLSGVYPSGPELSGLFGRLSKLSYASEFWFSVWSVVVTYASAVFISLVYVAIRDLFFLGVCRSSGSS